MATENTTEIQRLYDIATALDNGGDELAVTPAQYEAMYDEILEGSKGAQKTKMLAAQLIPKYLKYFPKFADKSINCLIDLCEEEDMPTRVNAIKALPVIAKITPDYLPKLADILGQLLQAEHPTEMDKVKQALASLLQQDLKGTLAALFNQCLSEDENLRIKAVAFIFEKVVPLSGEINKNIDTQKAVAEHVKKIIPHVVTAKEFNLFMELLSGLKIYLDGSAASELLDLLADINAGFAATEDAQVSKLTECLQSASTFLQRGASSAKFTSCLAEKVIPSFDQMSEQHQIELIQQLTDTTAHMLASDAKTLLPPLYTLLLAQLPLPPPTGQEDNSKINFSIVEAALYIFHLLAAKAPGSLRGLCGINCVTGQPSSMSTELAVEKKQDLDARLKFLESKAKKYFQQMEAVRKTSQKQVLIEVAAKTTHNVMQLAQNLLQRNPNFAVSSKLALSFKLAKKPQPQLAQAKSASPKLSAAKAPTTATGGGEGGASGSARPAFGNVYVPPNRQPGYQTKKRNAEAEQQQQQQQQQQQEQETTQQDHPQKKIKGRGTSKF